MSCAGACAQSKLLLSNANGFSYTFRIKALHSLLSGFCCSPAQIICQYPNGERQST